MRLLLLITALALAPSIALADITIQNNTSQYGTGKMGISPCSSIAKDKGIMQPGKSLTVPQSVLNFFCIGSCTAKVYMDKDCGKEAASVKIDNKKGVMEVQNHFPDQFTVEGGGKFITITEKSGWERFLHHFFN